MPNRRGLPFEDDVTAAWEAHADEWLAWARTPGFDSYWQFHRDQFLAIVPAPGRLTLDIGCGEGRVAADLARLGHTVIGIDASSTLVAAGRAAHPGLDLRVADAAALPLADGAADLAIAFMSLMDMNEIEPALHEAARVLESGGRLCVAIVHPLNSAGEFAGDEPDAPFTIRGSYLDARRYQDEVERDGRTMTFTSVHRPIEAYTEALAAAGFLVERLREPAVPDAAISGPSHRRWQRVPLFLHLRAVRR